MLEKGGREDGRTADLRGVGGRDGRLQGQSGLGSGGGHDGSRDGPQAKVVEEDGVRSLVKVGTGVLICIVVEAVQW